jgi:enolase
MPEEKLKKNKITDIRACEVIDNRGNPTVRVYASIDHTFWGKADVPSGSSTGSYEALEMRDGGARFGGKGVQKAIHNINAVIFPGLKGKDGTRQRDIDALMAEMDGTKNKAKLGANAILGVSLAVASAAAAACGLPLFRYLNANAQVLPVPQASLINGGLHAGNDLDIQEFCVMPVGAPSFAESVRALCEMNGALKEGLLKKLGKSAVNTSEDGGFAPPVSATREALDLLIDATERSGYAGQVVYALDFAANGFYDPATGKYRFEGSEKDRDDMIGFITKLIQEYPLIVAIEDPLYEDDFEGLHILTSELEKTMVIGDDFFATNIARISLGVAQGAGNATLLKLNQIGSLSEAMDAARYASQNKFSVVVSERSGETEDTILADVCVALNAGIIKTGGIRGSERGAKYNRFVEIEDEMGRLARYAGRNFRFP